MPCAPLGVWRRRTDAAGAVLVLNITYSVHLRRPCAQHRICILFDACYVLECVPTPSVCASVAEAGSPQPSSRPIRLLLTKWTHGIGRDGAEQDRTGDGNLSVAAGGLGVGVGV